MAVSAKGLLGHFSGRISNLVVYEVAGKTIIRSKPSVKYPAATGSKLRSQGNFSLVMGFMQACKPFIRDGFFHVSHGCSSFHGGLSCNLRNLSQSLDPDNYHWMQLSEGNRAGAMQFEAEMHEKHAVLSWGDPQEGNPFKLNDLVMVLALNPKNKNAVFSQGALRSQHQVRINLPQAEAGDKILFFLAFHEVPSDPIRKNPLKVSRSQMVGVIKD
jgi:hypothetical protein